MLPGASDLGGRKKRAAKATVPAQTPAASATWTRTSSHGSFVRHWISPTAICTSNRPSTPIPTLKRIGELQWRTKLPWELVLLHVGLAAAVWSGTVALAALFFRPPRSLLPSQHLN